MSSTDLWTHRDTNISTMNLEGFSIEAIDGSIGKIDEATNEVGSSYLVVDTGPWIFGKKVLLPAGVIDRVDTENETVYVNRTKDEIKDSPEFDESTLPRAGVPRGDRRLLRLRRQGLPGPAVANPVAREARGAKAPRATRAAGRPRRARV